MAETNIINGYQGQIAAINQQDKVFHANQNLFDIIAEEFETGKNYIIKRLGIQALPNTNLILNSIPVTIGKTGIYEVDDVRINQILLTTDSNSDMIIDYVIKEI